MSQLNKEINICYVDDNIDRMLNRYLDQYCENFNNTRSDNYRLVFSEYTFLTTDNYKTLLKNNLINQANIIVIDSRLFENESSSLSKFTGEQFKIILRQVLPFIKTIVISQNSIDSDSVSISKYQSAGSPDKTYQQYYKESLEPILDKQIAATIEEFKVIEQLDEEKEIDEVLIDTIKTTISGIEDATLFSKEDLDELISIFNEVKDRYGD